MSISKKINVSDQLHQQIDQETKRLKLSHKEYLEAAVSFFLLHNIDPRHYQPGTNTEVVAVVRQAVDRIFSYLVFQEQHVLKDIHTEVAKARIMGELSVDHLLSLITEDEAMRKRLQQQDQQYLTERLRQLVFPSDTTQSKS